MPSMPRSTRWKTLGIGVSEPRKFGRNGTVATTRGVLIQTLGVLNRLKAS